MARLSRRRHRGSWRGIQLFVGICCCFSLSRCFGADCEVAAFSIPVKNLVLVIERHPLGFLAEYDRTVILRNDQKEIARVGMARDTGGYSRTNLFRNGEVIYTLIDCFGDFYRIDAQKKTLEKLDKGGQQKSEFVGSFDVDSRRRWRFIPVKDRDRLQTGLSGG